MAAVPKISLDRMFSEAGGDNHAGKANMTPDVRFEKVVSGAAGRYVARIAGADGEAEIILTIHGPALIKCRTHART